MDCLSFKVSLCADVLDDALAGFNDETRVPERITAWRQRGEDPSRFPTIPVKGRLIAEINQSFEPSTGQMFCACTVRGEERDPQVAPVVFFNLQSPTLDIPMRVGVPLRALLKGGRTLTGTYSVYVPARTSVVEEKGVYA